MTKYIDITRKRSFDNYAEKYHISLEIGTLVVDIVLNDADRLRFVELLAGGSHMMLIELVGIGPNALGITPESLGVRVKNDGRN